MTKLDPQTARSSFEGLKKQARAEYERLFYEGSTTILVGTATCGRSAGALAVLQAFEEAVAKAGVDANILPVGCMGHCYAEPMAQISRPGFPALVYHHLNPIIARNLVEKFIIEGDALFEFLLGAAEPGDGKKEAQQ